jgi:hypothetical protein
MLEQKDREGYSKHPQRSEPQAWEAEAAWPED